MKRQVHLDNPRPSLLLPLFTCFVILTNELCPKLSMGNTCLLKPRPRVGVTFWVPWDGHPPFERQRRSSWIQITEFVFHHIKALHQAPGGCSTWATSSWTTTWCNLEIWFDSEVLSEPEGDNYIWPHQGEILDKDGGDSQWCCCHTSVGSSLNL